MKKSRLPRKLKKAYKKSSIVSECLLILREARKLVDYHYPVSNIGMRIGSVELYTKQND